MRTTRGRAPETNEQEPGSAGVEESDPLLEELRRIASLVEPVQPETVAAARGAFALRTIDVELAALVHDSLVDTLRPDSGTPRSRCC